MSLNKKIIIAALILIISPILSFAQTNTVSKEDAVKFLTYTLSNGRSFNGDYGEYLFAEYLLDVGERMQPLLDRSWSTTSRKNLKNFASTKQILNTVKFEGDAGYNSKTKEYYIKNNLNNSKNRIVFEVNNKNTKTSFSKLNSSYEKEFIKNFNKQNKKLQKDAEKKILKLLGVKVDFSKLQDDGEDEGVREGSDINYLVKVFEQLTEESDRDYASGFGDLKIALDGYSNVRTPVLFYTSDSKGVVSFPSYPVFDTNSSNGNIGPLESERSLPGVSLSIDELSDFDKYYINIEFDYYTPANTVVNFKINEIRQIGTLKPFDLWQKEFNYNEWKIERMLRDYGIDYFKNR